MKDRNLVFSFQFVELQKLDLNKASEENVISIKIFKQHPDIALYVLYHNFNNSVQ